MTSATGLRNAAPRAPEQKTDDLAGDKVSSAFVRQHYGPRALPDRRPVNDRYAQMYFDRVRAGQIDTKRRS
jgi:hypothetical protein